MSSLVGKNIGKYYILELLGSGGMGKVYKAYHPGLISYSAIKVIHSYLQDDDDKFAEFVERFQREAAATANLRHPNIVRVLDYDQEDDLQYMVMELVEGPTLEAELKNRRVKNRPFSPAEIATIFESLADAIDYAHAKGVIHHDLKPANIIFTTDRQVMLTDFGVSRLISAPTYTVSGNIMGTMAYISPEQVQGERTEKRSDIYSLGVIMYEMATGRIPFTSEQPATILYQHVNEPPPLPTTINPDIPEIVEQVILKALNKNPADRYQTAGDLVQALAEAIRADAFVTGKTLPDDYRKKEKIGEGGMAIVFRAYQRSQNRHVAIKILKPSLVNSNYISLLQRETEVIAQLNHPHILPIYDFKVEGDYSYIVMHYVEGGKTLKQVMQQPLDEKQAIKLISQIADALHHVHKRGPVHRNLKPNNVFMVGDWPLLADFGLVKTGNTTMPIDIHGIGTPLYMSPEQIREERVDHRTDIYTLGIILYEMVTGQVPFTGNAADIIGQHINQPPPLPMTINPDVSEAMGQVILKALNKNPADRYQTAGDLVQALAETIKANTFVAGETLPDDYRKKEKIGEGGMAVVFKAYQHSLNRDVAIKVLKPFLVAKNSNYIRLLQQEAELIAQLHHPNILPIYDFKIEGDYSYIVMRYVEGEKTLKQVIQQPLDEKQAIKLISQIADALHHVHKRGQVHRNLKPNNVFMAGDRPLLADFGLTKIVDPTTPIDIRDIGAPLYMSPEQIRGEIVDHRTDIYALGIILYEMVTGQVPFTGNVADIIDQHINQPPPPPTTINPDVSEAMEQVILKALNKNPTDRYQTAGDLASKLTGIIGWFSSPFLLAKKVSDSFNLMKFLVTRREKPFKKRVRDIFSDQIWQGVSVAIAVIALLVIGGLIGGGNAFSTSQLTPAQTSIIVAAASTPTPSPSPSTTQSPTNTPTPTNTPLPPSATPIPSATIVPTTITSTATPASLSPLSSTATDMSSPTPSPPTPTIAPTPTLTGTFELLKPLSLNEPSYGPTDFEWEWTGSVPPGHGFEIRVWREGEQPVGVHDAVLDNQNKLINNIGNNTYRLSVDIIEEPNGVPRHKGIYLWTVALVQISPDYDPDVGVQAEPARLRFETAGDDDDDEKKNDGGGSGVGID